MRLLRVSRIAGSVVLVCGVPVLTFWMGATFVELRNISKESLCEEKFADLACVLRIYHDEHGASPPTKYRATPNGPIHSWRVLLLPYMDMYTKELYSKYNFSENWDSPKNMAVARSLPLWTQYFCKGVGMDGKDIANYLAIGEGDEWPSEKPLKACLITKGKDHFLLVEYPESTILWTEPKY
jgi:hypothetical protein